MSDHSPHFCKSLKIEEAKVDLPDEILIDIVLRLPIKSIITWTSVSKSWNSLIKNPKFISTHLNHNNHNQKPQLLFLRKFGKSPWDHTAKKDEKEVYSLNWDNEAFDECTRFDFPFHPLRTDRAFHVVGTCNGLVCLANFYNFFVWNPCIRKYVAIPNFFADDRRYAGCGFGFDSKTNDYKVVKITDEQNQVKVYSLATGEWKMVSAVPRNCTLTERKPRQAFVNGALHWAAKRKTNDGLQNFILAFDLGDEIVREIMLPEDLGSIMGDERMDTRGVRHLCVSVFGESLAVYRRLHRDTCTEIWVMKEYGVLESWTKVLTVDSQGGGLIKRAPEAVGFRNNGEVVMEIETKQGKLVSLDPEHKKIKDLSLRVPYGFTFVDPYVESLALLNNSSFLLRNKQEVEEQDVSNHWILEL